MEVIFNGCTDHLAVRCINGCTDHLAVRCIVCIHLRAMHYTIAHKVHCDSCDLGRERVNPVK